VKPRNDSTQDQIEPVIEPVMTLNWEIKPLGKHHDRAAFSCEEEQLTDYLQKRASQDVQRFAAAVFVATFPGSARVVGYYSLSALSVGLDAIPEDQARLFARYPAVPVTLLGRLARDISQKNKKLGEVLLMDALQRAYRQSHEIASSAVVVDAKSERAATYYANYGFLPFPNSARRLFLPMKTIAKLF
jgi:predicted N-acetyltransferase YhbS